MHNPLTRFFDELTVGDTFVTRRRTITEADVVQWCTLTGDFFPLHLDYVYARESFFGKPIVPGLLVYAYCGGMWSPTDGTAVIAAYGIETLRFVKPVFIGDTVQAELRVEELRSRDNEKGVVVLGIEIHNERETVIVARQLASLRRTPTGEG